MSETPYPDYVQRMFAQAEAMITDPDYGPIEAAALCYEVLALFPDHAGAAALIHKALRAPSLIRDMRKSIGRHIDEWDGRPWQERRRLALSYRFLSRWESQDENYSLDKDEMWPADREAFEKYWKQALHELRIDPPVREHLRGVAAMVFLPWPLRLAGPLNLSVGHAFSGTYRDAPRLARRRRAILG